MIWPPIYQISCWYMWNMYAHPFLLAEQISFIGLFASLNLFCMGISQVFIVCIRDYICYKVLHYISSAKWFSLNQVVEK